MKGNGKRRIVYLTILACILVLGLAVLCVIRASAWEANTVSMISGLWSAVATFAVGYIAFYQNKKYKELADKLDIRQNAPEFYIPTVNINENQEITKISANGDYPKGLSNHGNPVVLSTLDKPVIRLEIDSIMINDEAEILKDNDMAVDAFETNSLLSISFSRLKPRLDGHYSLEIRLRFENIYGVHYTKKYKCSIKIKDNTILDYTGAELSLAEKAQ